ncbi:MAG: hypothetical protein Fur0025_10040 [Oscillatoriaceae cyanobacterium]
MPPLQQPIASESNEEIMCGINGEASAKEIFCHKNVGSVFTPRVRARKNAPKYGIETQYFQYDEI